MNWTALVLAAGRGPDDPMAKAYGVSHKCLLPVGGVPMLARVVEALSACPRVGRILIAIERPALLRQALGGLENRVEFIASGPSASASVLAALASDPQFPVLVTTGDHALLTRAMLDEFITASERSGADLTAGLASAQAILAAFPLAKRTFLKFGKDQVSGCNLYGFLTPRARMAADFWQHVEANRKSPFRLARAFGPALLFCWATGLTSLAHAFRLASRRLKLRAVPVLMRDARAAVDVDKPADKELAEEILKRA